MLLAFLSALLLAPVSDTLLTPADATAFKERVPL